MSFLDQPPALRAFRELFLAGRGLDVPRVRLAELPHWVSPVRAALPDGTRCDDWSAWVAPSYFYGFSSPGDPATVAAAVTAGADAGADCVLLPVVADPRPALAAGFVCVPWFFEAIYEVREDPAADLRASVGNKRAREVARLGERFTEAYRTRVVQADELRADPSLLDAFDRLHRLNLEKYGHRFNFYHRSVLDVLLRSELGDAATILFVDDLRTGGVVGTALGLLSADRREFADLVGGIDESQRRPGQNVYIGQTRALVRWGAELGVRRFLLGRGNEAQKIGLGANQIRTLYNCVLPLRQERDELVALAGAMTRRLSAGAAALVTSHHRDVTLPSIHEGVRP